MTIKALLIIAIGCIMLSGCDRPKCANNNPIFTNQQPESKAYKDELVKQLALTDKNQLTYWLQKYDDTDGVESLYFHIQGDGLCAILHLSMNHWNKLEHVRSKKGVGRRGAEFTNLKFDIVQDTHSTQFIYLSYDRLID